MQARRPIVLGIVGDSAAGKTTLTRGLVDLLGPDRVTHVCVDDYHKYDRRERAALGVTPLDPHCNHLDIVELHLERLHYGQPILKPVYEHAAGTLVRPAYVLPRELVIVEGLLGFHTPVMRQFYDVKVYLDPAEDLRRVWKIRRDTTKRGYTAEEARAEMARRAADSREFIRPQRQHADIAVHFYTPAGVAPEAAGPRLNVRLTLRPTIPHPDLTHLVDGPGGAPVPGIRFALDRDHGKPVDILEIDGSVTSEDAARLAEAIRRNLPGLSSVPAARLGNYLDRGEVRRSDPLALTQLLLTYHVLRERDAVTQRPFARPSAALSRLGLDPDIPPQRAADILPGPELLRDSAAAADPARRAAPGVP